MSRTDQEKWSSKNCLISLTRKDRQRCGKYITIVCWRVGGTNLLCPQELRRKKSTGELDNWIALPWSRVAWSQLAVCDLRLKTGQANKRNDQHPSTNCRPVSSPLSTSNGRFVWRQTPSPKVPIHSRQPPPSFEQSRLFFSSPQPQADPYYAIHTRS